MAFVPNRGQWEGPELFRASKGGVHVFLSRKEAAFLFEKKHDPQALPLPPRPDPRMLLLARHAVPASYQGVALSLRFLGTPGPQALLPESRLPGYHNYLLGNDRSRWRTHVPIFGKVRYRELYPGIDLVFRSAKDGFEYDLLLKPGADLEAFQVQVQGAKDLALAPNGDLLIRTELGPIRQPRPLAWETLPSGKRREIHCGFRLLGPDRFGFFAEDRHLGRPMTLDPKILWSSYIGGSDYDFTLDMDVDDKGYVTLVGRTNSPDYPVTKGAFQGSFHFGGLYQVDTVVSKIDFQGSKLVWSTFLGGKGDEMGVKIRALPSGTFAVAGVTTSKDFPVSWNAYQRKFKGGTFYKFNFFWLRFSRFEGDGFLSVLNPSGSFLIYSTYLGGKDREDLASMDANSKGVVALVGSTRSEDFPVTPGAFQPKLKGPISKYGNKTDAFVTVLEPLKGKVLWSTYLGSKSQSGGDVSTDVVVGEDGHVTVAGCPGGDDFPFTKGAWRTKHSICGDTFITRFAPSGKKILWSTCLAGQGQGQERYVYAGMQSYIREDKEGNVYIAGSLGVDRPGSLHFPTTKYAWDRKYNFDFKGLVVKLDSQGRRILWSTLLGSPRCDWKGMSFTYIHCLFLDREGNPIVGGFSDRYFFPVTPNSISGGVVYTGLPRAIISKLDSRGRKLLYSSYIVAKSPWTGAFNWQESNAIHVTKDGVATMLGTTAHTDHPVTQGAFQTSFGGGGSDGFITRFPIYTPGVKRFGLSTPHPDGEPTLYALKEPFGGIQDFGFECWKTPGSSRGFLLLGRKPIPNGLKVMGVTLYLEPLIIIPITSGRYGVSIRKYPLPASLKGASFYAQTVWIQAPNWGWFGPLCASDALQIDVF